MGLSLIGPRGAGKTTVGKLVASALDLEYVSTDQSIVEADGRTIDRIVAEDGWMKFRLIEEASLAKIAQAPGRLIDTGGGAVEVPGNRSLLKRYGPIIWLTASIATLKFRITGTAGRPPLTGTGSSEDEIEDVLLRREPLYRGLADFTVYNDGKEALNVSREIVIWVTANETIF